MRRSPRNAALIAAASLAAAFALAAARAAPPDLEPYTSADDVAARLERGELVELDGVRFDGLFGASAVADEDAEGELVMFLVDASEDAAWSVFTGYARQPEFMPHMVSARVAGEGAETHVCFDYEVLWVDSTNCFHVTEDRETGTLSGRLDAERSDDRLHGVNYFWHVRPWSDGRLLLAYYQALSYSSAFAAFGHEMFVGTDSTAEAVREEVRRVVAAGATQ